MANRLSLAVAMLVFALMPSDGLAAAKAPPLRGTGVRVAGLLLSDGERLVGVPDPTGMLVLDAATGQRGFVRSPPGCSPAGVGGGAAAFACAMTPGMAGGAGAIVDLVSGRQERLPEWSLPTFGYGDATVSGVGRRWVRLTIRGYHFAYDAFVERGNGRLVIGPPDANRAVDLDARMVWRRLCRPLRVRSWFPPEFPVRAEPGAPYAYQRPVGATISERERPTRQSIIVERCGRSRPLLVHRCVGFYCNRPVIARGVVAWREDDPAEDPYRPRMVLRAFLPRTRRLLSWRLTDWRFVLTAHRVWVVKDGRLHSARV